MALGGWAHYVLVIVCLVLLLSCRGYVFVFFYVVPWVIFAVRIYALLLFLLYRSFIPTRLILHKLIHFLQTPKHKPQMHTSKTSPSTLTLFPFYSYPYPYSFGLPPFLKLKPILIKLPIQLIILLPHKMIFNINILIDNMNSFIFLSYFL